MFRTTTTLFGIMTCANILPRCYGNILAATNYIDTSTSCLCASGMPYLSCYLNALSTAGCYEDLLSTVGMSPAHHHWSFDRYYLGNQLPQLLAHWNSYLHKF
jgi:hypothetical protein